MPEASQRQRISWADWKRDSQARRERTRRIVAGFRPSSREKPRDPVSAQILREMGTPEERIGPELPADPEDCAP